MSMKRILGTMLASRMGGRGGSRGALGTASALGVLGSLGRRRGGGMGSKLGLAALGYMAYQAYQGSQSGQSAPAGQTAGHQPRTAGTQATGGGASSIVDKLRDAANDFLGGGSGAATGAASAGATQGSADQDLRDSEAAAERFSEDEALLLIRAMITAAYSDGALSQDERGRIFQAIDAAEATPAERQAMEREIANPKPLETLLPEVRDQETAQEFYLASRAALGGQSEADRRYLAQLRDRLGLSEEEVAEADSIAS